MSETKFTSGPWRIEYGALRDPQDMLISADEYGIAKVWNVAAGKSSENIANAHLIAAAPDMYEALKALDAAWTKDFPDGPDEESEPADGIWRSVKARLAPKTLALWRDIRAALAKAEGRS